jgi:HK97 family phage major capsid protein
MSAIFTEKELSKYSLTRALGSLVKSQKDRPPGFCGRLDGFEAEVHDALSAHFRSGPGEGYLPSVLIPITALKTTPVQASQAQYGGFLVDTNFPASIVPALRSTSVCVALGASVFDSLQGDAAMPYSNATTNAQWLAELQAAADPSDMTWALTKLSPKRVVALTMMSKQLLTQSSLGIENFIRQDLLRVVGTALDKAALVGNGSTEPLGLLNRDEITSTVTFGAAATRSKMVDFQSSLALNNAFLSNIGYVTSPGTAKKLMNKIADTTGIGFTWQGNIDSGTVAGAPARSTTQIAAADDRVVFGSWDGLAIGVWGDALQVIVDTYTYKKQAIIEVQVTLLADCGVVQPNKFVVSTDSGAQ